MNLGIAMNLDELDPASVETVSVLCLARLEEYLIDRRGRRDPDVCPGCGTGEFGAEIDRVELNWKDCIVKPCRVCRPAEFAAFMARLAEPEEEPCPPTLPTGQRYSDGRPDPWDEPEENRITEGMTVREEMELERRNCKGYVGPLRDRDLWEDGK